MLLEISRNNDWVYEYVLKYFGLDNADDLQRLSHFGILKRHLLKYFRKYLSHFAIIVIVEPSISYIDISDFVIMDKFEYWGIFKGPYGYSTKNGERRSFWELFPISYNCIDLNCQTYTSLKIVTRPGRARTKTTNENIDKNTLNYFSWSLNQSKREGWH